VHQGTQKLAVNVETAATTAAGISVYIRQSESACNMRGVRLTITPTQGSAADNFTA
jgi:hypothetical protein